MPLNQSLGTEFSLNQKTILIHPNEHSDDDDDHDDTGIQSYESLNLYYNCHSVADVDVDVHDDDDGIQ